VLSVRQFTASDYPFGIFKLFKDVIIIRNNDIQTIQWQSEKEENGNNKRNV
jgi:hypothetical protein